ncbi:GPO family capsid scaffolding protein [Acidovorax sp. GBBC 3332]|nr:MULTISPECIES: GPO family capsid scaffolding protein [unclassified Acidovorax]MDA8448503.1 GPO family capsid scaffolding protein [Acidovorax sp. GBBC 3297]MDA8457530.1 GPO family capsid scaffolding protein [Acidovorax sp. GBBC 3333]MDA8462946.1 GPO family capsid scaffolding protein [Acidovorax sp. GBBC 3332]MDA8467600.1 GPO family capsid scaffolding protein [Acidovorax sp. GBBC 3299]
MPSKFFRVATEGATTDGREIQRTWIEQMAKNYKPATYSARVWLEHIRGVTADSAFAALGDVLALEARTVEDGKLALFAQIEALPSLVAMNKAKQKLFSSIEVDPNFAKTGEAYMTGLAVTDSPASLGTEVLKFAAGNPDGNPFAGKKHSEGALFSAAVETDLGLEGNPENIASGLLAKFTDMLGELRSAIAPKPAPAPEKPEAFATRALEVLGAADAAIQQQGRELAAERAAREKLQGEFSALTEKLSRQDGNPSQRPSATGTDASMKADC